MIGLDAGVIIAFLDRDDAQHSRAKLLAREIDEDFAPTHSPWLKFLSYLPAMGG